MKWQAAAAAALAISLNACVASAFTWGVSGHKIDGGSIQRDFEILEARGLTTYRFDVALKADRPEDADRLIDSVQTLVAVAKAHRVTLHPILKVPFTWNENATDGGKYPNTEGGLEAQGHDRVYPFVLRFSSDIRDWELQNELSLAAGVKRGVGNAASDYETAKAHQWAAVLRGMSRAVREVRAKTGRPLRVVVDVPEVDFGFIPFLEQNGVAIDKVGYHYYYKLETTPRRVFAPHYNGTFDIFAELKKLAKPVIINEFNAGEIYDPKTDRKPYDDAKALASLKAHLDYILTQAGSNVEGVEYYELYDEPNLTDPAESNFGLMHDATHRKTQILLTSVYACGALSPEEQGVLVASGLFTEGALSDKRKACPARITAGAPR
jgi:hypothetical protein